MKKNFIVIFPEVWMPNFYEGGTQDFRSSRSSSVPPDKRDCCSDKANFTAENALSTLTCVAGTPRATCADMYSSGCCSLAHLKMSTLSWFPECTAPCPAFAVSVRCPLILAHLSNAIKGQLQLSSFSKNAKKAPSASSEVGTVVLSGMQLLHSFYHRPVMRFQVWRRCILARYF